MHPGRESNQVRDEILSSLCLFPRRRPGGGAPLGMAGAARAPLPQSGAPAAGRFASAVTPIIVPLPGLPGPPAPRAAGPCGRAGGNNH